MNTETKSLEISDIVAAGLLVVGIIVITPIIINTVVIVVVGTYGAIKQKINGRTFEVTFSDGSKRTVTERQMKKMGWNLVEGL